MESIESVKSADCVRRRGEAEMWKHLDEVEWLISAPLMVAVTEVLFSAPLTVAVLEVLFARSKSSPENISCWITLRKSV